MSRYRQWILTLGIMAVTPGIAMAGPPLFSFLKPKAARSDSRSQAYHNQQVADRIAAAVRSADLNGYDIAIEYQNGVAALTGTVANPELKQKATDIVSRVPGVNKVDNLLKVSRPSAAERGRDARHGVQPAGYTAEQTVEPRRSAGKPKKALNVKLPSLWGKRKPTSNQEIAEQIADRLSRAGLNGFDIEIRYQNGMAQLSGTVSDESQVKKAAETVSAVPGVKSVRNRLTVAGQDESPVQHAHTARAYQGYRPVSPAAYQPMPGNQPPVPGANQPAAAPPSTAPAPQTYGHPGPGAATAVFNTPHMPDHAWPAQAQYPNYAAVGYPKQYSASAWPYIGPFYPYPQVPLGWRQVALQWDDGAWKLNFRPRTDRWWWFLNPRNW